MSEKTKSMCSGCRDNFYNGNNSLGVAECWHFKDAKVVQRVIIHRDQMPPYRNLKTEPTLSCWYGDHGLRAYSKDSFTSEGYWKP